MIIFARPEYEYDSYRDCNRIIELSGFPMCKINEIDPASDHTYIITCINGEVYDGWPDARARIIHFNLEWGEYHTPGVKETWCADKYYAKEIGAKYVPFGSHPDLPLGALDNVPKIYDAAMLSYFTNRRMQMRAWLFDAGVQVAPNGWNMERHNTLIQSRFMLHVHQHDNVPTIAPQRFALAAAYKMPVISEQVNDQGVFHGSSVLWCDYPHLPAFVRMWKDDMQMRDRGEALHYLLCVDKTFRRNVEDAL